MASDDVVELVLSHGLPVAMAVSRTHWPEGNLTRVQSRLNKAIDKRRAVAKLVRAKCFCLPLLFFCFPSMSTLKHIRIVVNFSFLP